MKGLVLAGILALASPALVAGGDNPVLPDGASCAQVRQLVKEHGYIKSIAWAREHGYTWRQIAEAKKCLRVSLAHDDGRYAGSPLKQWFDGLRSGKGPCCSDADGAVIKDTDWEAVGGHYRVRMPYDGDTLIPDPRLVAAAGSKIEWRWIDVPDEAVIKEPNRFGQTMVWAIGGNPGSIRCFMPGSMI